MYIFCSKFCLSRPERFLSPDGKLQQDEQFVPFSIGRRKCPGESLAKIELFQFFTGYSSLHLECTAVRAVLYCILLFI